ncbi:MAG TPA: nitroreductase family deazaflavin-dependent oxidoreductase [Solirubrobacteraceae bacterium]|jgi:deazaflavin-dependent oxidoreductase (nitroreductase family)|nr:nitroreductase family deazaflavin-dependent oxidoreductase [Solirubrobacteraceae bacterium]
MSALGKVLSVHQMLYERSGGRVGHRMLGTPTLLLRTTGRRSGQPRTNALVYLADGEDYVVVASKGGDDHPPAWLLNLAAKPEVEVQIGRERRPASARVVEQDDPDFARLWKGVNENNSARYDGYQAKTERRIPLVVLTPR